MKIIYLSMGGIQNYNDFVAKTIGAERLDTQFFKFPFQWRYWKFLNVPFLFTKVPDADAYLCEAWWDLAFAATKKMLGGKHKIIMLWVFPMGIEYEQMPFLKRMLLPIQRFLSRYIDVAITDSKMNELDVIAVAQNPKMKVVNAYPFVVENAWNYRAHYLKDNMFINVSRDTEEKGLRNLEAAFKQVPYELVILNQFCEEPRREGNIVTHGKAANFHDYLSIFTFYPHYPNYECFGVAQLEAMAIGVIPIVGGKCGLAEVLEEEGLGILIAKNKQHFVEKIQWAAHRNLLERRELSDKVRKVARKFTKDRTAEALRGVLQ